MADMYSLFAEDEPTQQEQAMALANQLRGKRGLGEVFALHPLLRQQGQAMFGDAQGQEQMLADAGKFRLTKALQAKQALEHRQQQLDDTASQRTYQEGRDERQNAEAMKRTFIMAGQQDRQRKEDRADADRIRKEQMDYANSLKDKDRAEAKSEKAKQGMAEVDQRANTILQNIDLLENQLKTSGTYELFGEGNDVMSSRVGDIAVDAAKLKDPGSAALPGEVEREKKSLIEPDPFALRSTQLKKLEELKRSVEARRQEAYKVRGLMPPGGPVKISGDEDFEKLPSGATFVGPDGVMRTKP
jgi:hypothetical protein